MKHTPAPWKYIRHGQSNFLWSDKTNCPLGVDIQQVLGRPEHEVEANAAHIIKCVNAHDELVMVLKDLVYQCHAYGNSDDLDLPNTYTATQLLSKLEGGDK
jgi:hypothetical protein